MVGQTLERVRLVSPFVLRSVSPPIADLEGTRVTDVRRHRQADRLRVRGRSISRRAPDDRRPVPVAADSRSRSAAASRSRLSSSRTAPLSHRGQLEETRLAARRRRRRRHWRRSIAAALEVLGASSRAFVATLLRENHTLKRALTDPRLFSGIGNAYSDEILHRARLSPLQLTARLTGEQIARLFDAVKAVLAEWTDRLRQQRGSQFPAKVTAFHPEMAVHGKFGQPCPVCGSPVRRIVYAENEMQLLRDLPDRRQAPRRSRDVAPAQEGLAAQPRRVGRACGGPDGRDREPEDLAIWRSGRLVI